MTIEFFPGPFNCRVCGYDMEVRFDVASDEVRFSHGGERVFTASGLSLISRHDESWDKLEEWEYAVHRYEPGLTAETA